MQIRAIALASPQSLLGVGLRGVHIVTALSYYWLSLWTDKITVSELATRQDSERMGDFHIPATVVSVPMQGMQHDNMVQHSTVEPEAQVARYAAAARCFQHAKFFRCHR